MCTVSGKVAHQRGGEVGDERRREGRKQRWALLKRCLCVARGGRIWGVNTGIGLRYEESPFGLSNKQESRIYGHTYRLVSCGDESSRSIWLF